MSIDALLESVAERAARKAVAALRDNEKPEPLDFAQHGIEPLRVYSVKEVARFLGTKRLASVYAIDEAKLPRAQGVGSSVGFLGINVLCYMAGLEPVDFRSAVEAYRKHLLNDRPSMQIVDRENPNLVRVL